MDDCQKYWVFTLNIDEKFLRGQLFDAAFALLEFVSREKQQVELLKLTKIWVLVEPLVCFLVEIRLKEPQIDKVHARPRSDIDNAFEVLCNWILSGIESKHLSKLLLFIALILLVDELAVSFVQKKLDPGVVILFMTWKDRGKDWELWSRLVFWGDVIVKDAKVEYWSDELVNFKPILESHPAHFLTMFVDSSLPLEFLIASLLLWSYRPIVLTLLILNTLITHFFSAFRLRFISK